MKQKSDWYKREALKQCSQINLNEVKWLNNAINGFMELSGFDYRNE